MREHTREKIKAYTMEYIDLKNDKKDLDKTIKEKLDQNTEYKDILTQIKQLKESLDQKREEVLGSDIIEQETVIKANMTMIKANIKQAFVDEGDPKIESQVINDMLKFREIVWTKNKDLLKKLNNNYVEAYEMD